MAHDLPAGGPLGGDVTPPASEDASEAVAGPLPPLTRLMQALMILGGVGVFLGFGVGFLSLGDELVGYMRYNQLDPIARRWLLAGGAGGMVTVVLAASSVALVRRRRRPFVSTLNHVARRIAPLGPVATLPLLFNWRAWNGLDLTFLAFVLVVALCLEVALRSAFDVGPVFPGLAGWREGLADRLRPVWSRFSRRLPLAVVVLGALGYVAYFAYYTVAWHLSVRSSYDLAIFDNLSFNVVHGGPFFKAAPTLGPTGSHFGRHATLLAYAIAPFYALHPGAETLLVVQSALLGLAAIPLFLVARLYLSVGVSTFIALAYLMYPPLHGANLFEFHYLPLGTFFLWTCLYALETRRNWLALIAIVLTLSVREDVAASLAIWGAYLLISGRRPLAGTAVIVTSMLYFAIVKMVIMRRLSPDGGESFTFFFKELLPAGQDSFGAVLGTVFGNPWYTVNTLITRPKLTYLLQLLVPLALVPLRRPMVLLLALPGLFFTMLTTAYPPSVSTHYQYTAHWTTFLFIGAVLSLARMDRVRRLAACGSIGLAMLATSYQFGSILQRNTSWGGPVAYKFGMDDEGRQRRRALDALLEHLPADATVTASGFLIPQVSNRQDAYTLTLGVYDAEYVIFPSERADFIANERETVMHLLQQGTYGVVAVEPPFALIRRGHPTGGNAALLARIR